MLYAKMKEEASLFQQNAIEKRKHQMTEFRQHNISAHQIFNVVSISFHINKIHENNGLNNR